MVKVRVVAMSGKEALVEYYSKRYWVWIEWLTLSTDQRTAEIDKKYLNSENEARQQ